MGTDFNIIYTRFYSKITDDMYMELDQTQTDALLEELLINALPWFEFPKVSLQYSIVKHCFRYNLSDEEINIIATYMVLGWFDQQLASVEVSRMKYSGSDFKMTSQANHMAKLKELRKEYERIGFHLQRLYKRRKTDSTGRVRSTFGSIMASSVRGGIVKNSSTSSDNNGTNDGDNTWEDMGDEKNPSNDSSSSPGEDGWDDMEELPSQPSEPSNPNSDANVPNDSPLPDDGWDSM
jgi:hypothetical protein